MTSTRQDGDSWDLASSVGAAATMAATARAIVSRADRSLIDGPFAEPLVRGRSLRDLLAADNLPPLEDDDLRMGDVLYVSGTLISSKHRKQTVSIDSA